MGRDRSSVIQRPSNTSFKTFIVADRCIAEYGVSYDEYKEVAEKFRSLGHGVDWLVPKDTFDFLVEERRSRILER